MKLFLARPLPLAAATSLVLAPTFAVHLSAMQWLGCESSMLKASSQSSNLDSSTRAPSVTTALSSAGDDVSTVLGSVDFRDLPKVPEDQTTELGMDGTQMESASEEDSGKDTEYSKTSTRMSKSRPSAARSSGRKNKKLKALEERTKARGGTWEDQNSSRHVVSGRSPSHVNTVPAT